MVETRWTLADTRVMELGVCDGLSCSQAKAYREGDGVEHADAAKKCHVTQLDRGLVAGDAFLNTTRHWAARFALVSQMLGGPITAPQRLQTSVSFLALPS